MPKHGTKLTAAHRLAISEGRKRRFAALTGQPAEASGSPKPSRARLDRAPSGGEFEPVSRRCLNCREHFTADGRFTRLCTPCHQAAGRTTGYDL